ncbi:restriction endonuclease subunit S [Moritella marina]|uniref:restriction endonuclease subunit S n=1 Tax=Moritella marina TaxID=90736 RepID=UPI00370493B0
MVELAKMPKYEAYKNSGIDWLGNVPATWNIYTLKRTVDGCTNGLWGDDPKDESDIIVLRVADFDRNKLTIQDENLTYRNIPIKERRGRLLKKGDLLIEKSGGGDKTLVGCVVLFDKSYEAVTSNFVAKMTPKHGFYSNYLKYVFSSLYDQKINYLSIKQTTGIQNLDSASYLNEKFAFPIFSEQRVIAHFLDNRTALIDDAIAIKQQQILLLKERKQIIIQEAVTRGLNPDVPMKCSGVDWIGDIPEHWEIKRAKYLFKEIDERSVDGKEELLSVSHITGITPRSEKSVTMIAEDYSGSKTCQKNDLVMNIMWAWMGALGVSGRPGIVSSAYSIFRQTPLNIFNPIYLEWLLKTVGYIEHYNRVSTGLHSSRLRFYSRMFFDMEIGYPSRNEQDEIVTHIEKQSFKIDEAVELQKQQIEKLKEYKTTLINSAITGKIKVPEVDSEIN